jgi:DNA repair protein RadD
MQQGYFRRVYANIAGNPKLREPQIQAYLKIKEHFDSGETGPALAVLPTGTGKTGLLALIPYGVAERRVLVITPSLVIRDGIMKSLDSSNLINFWHQHDVIHSRRNLPEVVEYGPDLPIEILEKANFVVVNIHKTQLARMNSLLGRVPSNFFDMVIIDEAHHSAAQSWVDLERHFSAAKVVKLTGTPWRTDNARIFAKEVYNYPLGRAMVSGYAKRLVNKTWLPQELTFTVEVDGVIRTLGYQEAMEIKESEWVSRHVAYSPECNRMVVERSLDLMRTQRDSTGKAHKIIAVAMTIEHAQAVRSLYEGAGASASVISSDMEEDDKKRVLNDFENDRTQVLVNVNMLGEGFDHPLISVAAVFRPFRSLLPYVQFAGRALRVIPDGSVVDNTAHLVHHKALNLDDLWEYFRQEERRAEVIEHLQAAEKEWQKELSEAAHKPGPTVSVVHGGALDMFSESFSDEADFVKE